jgi:D-glycero-alpha-D-manno-heptose-7-phosphate kinase
LIVTQTPLRISLAGGGTDFEDFYKVSGGSVVSVGINKYVYVVLKERFDNKIRIGYSKTEIVDEVSEIQHELVREAMREVGIGQGLEVVTMADIPSEGSGLGSSSSVLVGLLNALYAYRGDFVPAEYLAHRACQIEINVLGRPIGKQDQYIAAFGGLRYFKFQEGYVGACPIDLEPSARIRLEESLLLFYTGVTRNASSILQEQKENIEKRRVCLERLRDQSDSLFRALLLGEVETVGSTLRTCWEYKKQLAGTISTTEIDEFVCLAHRAGAVGCKITGAGGGGFLLVSAPREKHDAIRKALPLREMPFSFARDGSKIIFNTRR